MGRIWIGGDTRIAMNQIVLCAGKQSQIQDSQTGASELEKARVRGQLAVGPGSTPGAGLEGLGRDPAGRGQEEGRDAAGTFLSVALDSAPKGLFFPSFAKHFSAIGNNLNV